MTKPRDNVATYIEMALSDLAAEHGLTIDALAAYTTADVTADDLRAGTFPLDEPKRFAHLLGHSDVFGVLIDLGERYEAYRKLAAANVAGIDPDADRSDS